MVLVLVGFGFNAVYSQPVVASNRDVFPLNLFPSVSVLDASPMDSTYYLSWNGLVVYNDWSVPIGFYHGLNLHDLNLSLSFDLQTDRYASFNLVEADNYTMGVALMPVVSLSNLSVVSPVSFSGRFPHAEEVSVFGEATSVYDFGLTSKMIYRLDNSTLGRYYVVAFKFTNDSEPQSLMFNFRNSRAEFNYSISNDEALISY